MLSSVPFAVRVGFVIGADITAVLGAFRRPCDTVPTGIGERGEGASLSYGIEDSSKLRPETDGCLDL